MEKFTTDTGLEYVLLGDKVIVKGAQKKGPRVLKFRDTFEALSYYRLEKGLWGKGELVL